MEYYSAIKNNVFESVLLRWMKLEPIMHSKVNQKKKLMHIMEFRKMVTMTLYARQQKIQDIKNRLWDSVGENKGAML